MNTDSTDKYPFLHAHIAKEPHVFEVLEEISRYQHEVLKNDTGKLATLEVLKDSRNIKMPITPVRGKNIVYIIETLSSNYPEEIKKIFSYRFVADPDTKKLTIEEETELTVLSTHPVFKKLQDERDEGSLASLHELLTKFRLFNLTKLINKAKNKSHLAEIIKDDLGKNIFSFKHFTMDKNNLEISEDYCFHASNYDPVKKSVQSDGIKKILSSYSTQVSRRLQKFGILNADFNDYRDSKVDYLLSILLEDIPTTLAPKDLVEVKNFNSLRSCLTRVEKVLDPLVTVSNDLLKQIRDTGITRFRDILAEFNNLNEDMLNSWITESAVKCKIIKHSSDDETYLIDGTSFLKMLTNHHIMILYNQDEFAKLSSVERQSLMKTFEMLCDAGKNLLNYEDSLKPLLSTDEAVSRLKKIIKEYEDYKKRQIIQESMEKEQVSKKEKTSFFGIIASFIQSLFGVSSKSAQKKTAEPASSQGVKHAITREAKDIIQKIRETRSKISALSNYIELSDENNFHIDSIIDELRSRNLKTVIPIYNARKCLYPQRSRKYLISDVEYLMVDTDIIQGPDSIRSFTDSLGGEKIKDETMPPAAIMTVERYLLTLYRQKRAQMKRKEQKEQKKDEG